MTVKIGDNIKKFRELHNLKQEDLGNRIGVGGATISSWEKGRTEPNMGFTQKLADFFNVTTDELIYGIKLSSLSGIIPIRKIRKLPILGTTCAGDGVWCEENYEDYISVDDHIKADFALRVQGNSMINANIHDGDIAFFQKTNSVDNGNIACVLLTETNEVMLKKVLFADNNAILQPCNDEYQPVITNDFIVLGLLKGIYKEINQ